MYRLLIIEDSKIDQSLVVHAFKDDYNVTVVDTLASARQQLSNNSFDLILLDILLPDGNGLDFCNELQNIESTQNIPVIFLTAQEGEENKVMGFTIGADDYVTKPFNRAELRARVEARIRKSQQQTQTQGLIKKGDLTLNMINQKVTLNENGVPHELDLTPLEFKLLAFLAQNENQIFNREIIIANVWGKNISVSDRNIDTQISGLRKKLGIKSHYISSVYGQGYKFTSN